MFRSLTAISFAAASLLVIAAPALATEVQMGPLANISLHCGKENGDNFMLCQFDGKAIKDDLAATLTQLATGMNGDFLGNKKVVETALKDVETLHATLTVKIEKFKTDYPAAWSDMQKMFNP
jgi:hypothetical protein